MFDGLLKTKFYTKCKSSIKLSRTRIELIKRKRNAMQKYLKNDITDLLKNGLDLNAYGRAEGFLVEMNLSSCYDFVEECCVCISSHLSIMNKQRECPEECKEAIPSLMFAAARFSDLPELRELRSLFAERYGNSLDPYANEEFVKKLKSVPPTKDMKLRLIQDIALESDIEWDSKALEQKLYKPPPSEQNLLKNTKDDKRNMPKIGNEPDWKMDNKNTGYKPSDVMDYKVKERRNQEDLSARGRKDVTNDGHKLQSRRDYNKNHLSFMTQKSTPVDDIQLASVGQNGQQNNPKSAKSASKVEVDEKKQVNYRVVPPPYHIKPKVGTNETNLVDPPTSAKLNVHVGGEDNLNKDELIGEAKQIPRSVRRIRLKPPPGHENVESAKQALKILNEDRNDRKDGDERVMDRLLLHYSAKQSPSEPVKVESALKQPPLQQDAFQAGKAIAYRSKGVLQSRQTSLPTEPTSPIEETKGHVRASSFQPEILNQFGHVHPNLPDYDDFVARLAALRGSEK